MKTCKRSVAQIIAGLAAPGTKPKADAEFIRFVAAVKAAPDAPLPKSLARPPAF